MTPPELSQMEYSRRAFLGGAASTLVLGNAGWDIPKRLKIAALTTTFYKYSHSEHIVDRFLEGYGWDGSHHRPPMDVVSLYVEQVGENDLSRERAKRHPGLKIYPTIAEALTCGGKDLAVDAVLLIAEHGQFPKNEKGQTLYPRYEYFQQIVDVYRSSGKTAPVFNDKHLSWSWDHADDMVRTARAMGFGLMAGSSLPVTWRQPPADLPKGAEVEEAVAIWSGWKDGGDIHVIEALQSIVERRKGGESGVKAVQALRGEAFWKAIECGSWDAGGWDPKLLEACLCRSNQLNPARPTYSHVYPSNADLRRLAPEANAYRFEYEDGLKVSIVQFEGGQVVGDCSVVARMKGNEIFSVLMYLPYYTMRNFFSPLVHHIESFFQTGKPPYPIERTLLTTGMTAAGIESSFQGDKRLETPHLAVRYQPSTESTFWRS